MVAKSVNCPTVLLHPPPMVAREAKDWTLRVNVKNLFDRLYWDAIYDNGGFATPGPRRTVVVSAELKF